MVYGAEKLKRRVKYEVEKAVLRDCSIMCICRGRSEVQGEGGCFSKFGVIDVWTTRRLPSTAPTPDLRPPRPGDLIGL